MDKYILIRTSLTPRKYVADPRACGQSYTNQLRFARRYPTREAADGDRCVENERVSTIDEELDG